MRRRPVVITLSLLVVGALSVALALSTSSPHDHASISGQLLISGGPAPGTPRPSDGEVTARNATGQSFAVSVPATGRFIVYLPAGTYTLTGSSPQFGASQYMCNAQHKVKVIKGSSIREDVYCNES